MPKKQKLSQWHDGSVKPVHVGVYEVICGCCWHMMYSRYNGKFFCSAENTVDLADQSSIKDHDLILKNWRGLVK